jgi:hypothetical protein
LIKEAIPFSTALDSPEAVWVAQNSATILDFGSFSLAAIASSRIIQDIESVLVANQDFKITALFKLASMDTGVAPFPVSLVIDGQTGTVILQERGVEPLEFFRAEVLFRPAVITALELQIVTGDAAKAATLQMQQLFIEQLTF